MKQLVFLTFIGCVACSSPPHLPDPHEAGWKGEQICEVIFENEQQRVLRCTFPPGTGHEKHYHEPHFGYTVKGSTFRMISDNGTREVDVPSGSHFHNSEIIEHEVLNIGDSTAVFLIFEVKN